MRLWPRSTQLERQLTKMRKDWDRRGRENARHFVANGQQEWTDEEFFASGESSVWHEVLSDSGNVCQGKDPKTMRVLEIGCGAGRMTRALAKAFGEVHAVDVSGEMVERTRLALRDMPNAHVYQNNGMDLRVVPELGFDFAFSVIVFQHIPSHEVIRSYVREVARLLRPGALFKFQTCGMPNADADPFDTWVGASFSLEMARSLAAENGFECRHHLGEGTQFFWLWYFKNAK